METNQKNDESISGLKERTLNELDRQIHQYRIQIKDLKIARKACPIGSTARRKINDQISEKAGLMGELIMKRCIEERKRSDGAEVRSIVM